ncbi:MAG: 23S rRNA (uracil(1939)-C(5))-methyltransferase RlmD [Candidatus Dadabacteria bacterium]|nr:23S rRNA (uracil(1939)-C(5))-methyltransferase RlmD [Candidatus Dadabacteria bacterium]NIV41591.1 23S rRNA (uracil(1939)-C(5))-methyltransferase RlmD [Candidatus Dadabacteria bacterium]NIX15153.1 23S rRNA (uracil(1939)-C(5))-methyltransferase RlmD [Candidatus Dadabacteria bacterium]NIY21798.1 23S rRNA (uracil(1939)-C(5))-methyltransferase RlmD [Candidatus Dadabacteria bacterium]
MKLKIEKLIYGGYGLVRTEDKVVFVKGGVPGDELSVNITEEKKSFDIAEIDEILKPSEYRVEPECEYFGNCGGCKWQHIDYEYQLRAKEQIIKESLERIAGIADCHAEPIIASSNRYDYRGRVMLHVDTIRGKHVVGFKEEKSDDLVPVSHCKISLQNISELIKKISKFLGKYNAKTLPIDKVFVSDFGSIPALTLSPKRNSSPEGLVKLYYYLKERIQGADISLDGKDEKSFEFKVLGIKYISSPSVFAQANSDINEKLIKTLLKWADLKKEENVLDLYCGYGNFSLHLARKAKYVLGIDSNKKAIRFAIKNAKLNSVRNCRFEDWDVKKYLQRHKPAEGLDLVVLDPPRTGAKEIIKSVISLDPKKILYVSCNPTTLARDLKELISAGYKFKKIQPFDMFPQTFHIESLTLLQKELE